MQPLSVDGRPSLRLNLMQNQKVTESNLDTLKNSVDVSNVANVALQAMEIVEELQQQVTAGEQLRKALEEKILERNKFYKDVASKIDVLVKQKDEAMTSATSCQAEALKLKHDICDINEKLTSDLAENKKLTSDVGSLQKRLQSTESELNSKWEESKSNQRQIRTLELNCVSKQRDIISLQAKCDDLMRARALLEQKRVEHEARLEHGAEESCSLKQQINAFSARLSASGTVNEMTSSNMEKLLSEICKLTNLLDEERVAKGHLVIELKSAHVRKETLMEEARTLGQELERCKSQIESVQLQNQTQCKDFADREVAARARYAELKALSEGVTKDKVELEARLASAEKAVVDLQSCKESVEKAFACAVVNHKVETLAVEKKLEDSHSASADLQTQLQGECSDKVELEARLALSEKAIVDLQSCKESAEKAFSCAVENHKVETLAVEKKLEDSQSALAYLQAQLQDERQQLEKKLEESQSALADLQAQLQGERQQLEKKVEESQSAVADLQAQLQGERQQLQESLDKALLSAEEAEKTCRSVKEEFEKQLQAKDAELQKNLREISHQNNQAIAEMRQRYEDLSSADIQATKLQAEKELSSAEEKSKALKEQCNQLEQLLKDVQEEEKALKLGQEESMKSYIDEISKLKAAQTEVQRERLEEKEEVSMALNVHSQIVQNLQEDNDKLKDAKNAAEHELCEMRKESVTLKASQVQIEVDLSKEREENKKLAAALAELQKQTEMRMKESAVQRQCVTDLRAENTNLKAALGSLCQVKNAHPPQPPATSKAKPGKTATAEKSLQPAQHVQQKRSAGRKKKVMTVADVVIDETLNSVPQVVQQQVEREEVVQVTSPDGGRRNTPRKRARAETVVVCNVKKGPRDRAQRPNPSDLVSFAILDL